MNAETHGIAPEKVHPRVHFICSKLQQSGYTAWLVGGAVRDFFLGMKPKDFDVVCSANTRSIRMMFRNSRTIGKRFPLVLVEFPDLIVQVSSFRSDPQKDTEGVIRKDNRMGNPQEDALRRDFSVNGMMMELDQMTLIDYVGGLEDVRAKKLRSLKPPEEAFVEDPVRMLRAVRFSSRLQLELSKDLSDAITKKRGMLTKVNRYRLNQELYRFCYEGMAAEYFQLFDELGLLSYWLGMEHHDWFFDKDSISNPFQCLKPMLKRLDSWHDGGGEMLPQTVVLLGFLGYLARSLRLEAMLQGKGLLASPRRALLWRRLPKFMLQWGFLKGQTEPALQILKAAQKLLSHQLRPVKASEAVAGTREAWLLLNLLAGPLQLEAGLLKQGLATLSHLPDLPILDHPRPKNRLRSQNERPGSLQRANGNTRLNGRKAQGVGAKKSSRRRRYSSRQYRRNRTPSIIT